MKERIGGGIKCVVCGQKVESETMDITCGNACALFLSATTGVMACPDCGSTDIEATNYAERLCRHCDGLFFIPSEDSQRRKQCIGGEMGYRGCAFMKEGPCDGSRCKEQISRNDGMLKFKRAMEEA